MSSASCRAWVAWPTPINCDIIGTVTLALVIIIDNQKQQKLKAKQTLKHIIRLMET